MAGIDIGPFGEHNRTEEPTDENIPLDPVTSGGRSTWEPEREQELSFRGKSLETLKYEAFSSYLRQGSPH